MDDVLGTEFARFTKNSGVNLRMYKRGRGRPPRGAGEVGRAKIIEATRSLVRSFPMGDVSRKDIAKAAGVTPALVSYYFPNHSTLLRESIKPVVDEYLEKLYKILHAGQTGSLMLKALIRLFIEFNKEEALLLDNYLQSLRLEDGASSSRVVIDRAYSELVGVLERALEREGQRGDSAPWLIVGIWGMCKSISQTRVLPITIHGSNLADTELVLQQTENIYSLFRAGIMTHPDAEPIELCHSERDDT